MLHRRDFLVSMSAAATAAQTSGQSAIPRTESYPAPDRELMVPVSGGRVYVRVNGSIDGPRLPLLLIHGGPGGTHASLINSLALSDERAVILYDQLDTGKSDHPNNPANWTVSRFRDEVEAIRIAVGARR